jgi:hypothetical protein
LTRFDDGLPDFIGRLRKSFKAGDPLIPSLNRITASFFSLLLANSG